MGRKSDCWEHCNSQGKKNRSSAFSHLVKSMSLNVLTSPFPHIRHTHITIFFVIIKNNTSSIKFKKKEHRLLKCHNQVGLLRNPIFQTHLLTLQISIICASCNKWKCALCPWKKYWIKKKIKFPNFGKITTLIFLFRSQKLQGTLEMHLLSGSCRIKQPEQAEHYLWVSIALITFIFLNK